MPQKQHDIKHKKYFNWNFNKRAIEGRSQLEIKWKIMNVLLEIKMSK